MDVQPGLCRIWSETPNTGFSHNEVHILKYLFINIRKVQRERFKSDDATRNCTTSHGTNVYGNTPVLLHVYKSRKLHGHVSVIFFFFFFFSRVRSSSPIRTPFACRVLTRILYIYYNVTHSKLQKKTVHRLFSY